MLPDPDASHEGQQTSVTPFALKRRRQTSTGGMRSIMDRVYWRRALREPIVWLGLVVDLLPVYAVLVWGWGAIPLVMFYWLENVLAGVMTLPRVFIASARYGIPGFIIGLLLCAFFIFHYGLFCLVHGTFLVGFTATANPALLDTLPLGDMTGIIRFALTSGANIIWALYGACAFQILVFLREFIVKGAWKTAEPFDEMLAPYGRVIVLHFALFAGAAALLALGQPLAGVLGLIILRAGWGVFVNAGRIEASQPREKSGSE